MGHSWHTVNVNTARGWRVDAKEDREQPCILFCLKKPYLCFEFPHSGQLSALQMTSNRRKSQIQFSSTAQRRQFINQRPCIDTWVRLIQPVRAEADIQCRHPIVCCVTECSSPRIVQSARGMRSRADMEKKLENCIKLGKITHKYVHICLAVMHVWW